MESNMKNTDSKTDSLDRRIAALLRKDGRITNKEIAAKTGISEGTVRNRVRKLLATNTVRVAGLANPDFLPEKNLVLVEAKVAVTKDLEAVAAKIARLPAVLSVYLITGRMDIMIEAFVEAKFGLVEFVGKQIASVNGIVSTETHVVMKQYKKWLDVDL